MKFINLIFLKLIEKKYLYIVLVLQIFIGTYTVNMAVGTFRYYNYIFDTSIMMTEEKPLLIGIKSTAHLQEKEESVIRKKLTNLYNIKEIAMSESLNIKVGGEPYKLILYDTDILNLVKRPLSSGSWLKKTSSSPGANPIVITESLAKYYKLGDSFKIDSVYDKTGKAHSVIFKVYGIIKKPEFAWNFDFGSSMPRLQFLLNRQSNSIFSGPIKNTKGEIISGYIQPQILALLKDKSKEVETVKYLSKLIGDKFNISTFDETVKNGRENSEDDIFSWATYSLITILLIIVGLGGNNILLLHQQFKEYGVYFLCGASKLKLTLINAATNLLIVSLPSALAIATIMIQRNSSGFYNLIFDINSVIFSISTSIIVFILSTSFVLLKLYRQQPVSIVRGNL